MDIYSVLSNLTVNSFQNHENRTVYPILARHYQKPCYNFPFFSLIPDTTSICGLVPSRSPMKSRLDQSSADNSQLLALPGMTKARSKSTINNVLSTVRVFESWLRKHSDYKETRSLEALPPAELDTYLTSFFSTVTKPAGCDYTPDSFRLLRSKLDHYLRSQGYRWSVVTSPEFRSSQFAFRRRKSELTKKPK